MGKTGALWRFFYPIEISKMPRSLFIDKTFQQGLFCFREPREDRPKDAPIDEFADTGGKYVEGSESRKLAMLFDERFNCYIDEIGWGIHDLHSGVHGLCCDMTDVFSLAIDFKLRSNKRMIA